RDPQTPQVVDDGSRGEAGVGAAQRRRHIRMLHRESANVKLVDHRVMPWDVRRPVVAPGECRVDYLALRHRARSVAAIKRQVTSAVADGITVQRVTPSQRTYEVERIRVEQQLVRIEAHALLRAVGPMHAIAV